MRHNKVKLGFIAAAAMNIGGVLIFSRAFNNPVINEFDPVVMSNFGLVMIIVWGLVFLGTAFIESSVKWLAGAFAIEKSVYIVTWLLWHLGNSIGAVFERDFLAGAFYSLYGINDMVFLVFFLWVFFTDKRRWSSHQVRGDHVG